jgi:predicted ATPase
VWSHRSRPILFLSYNSRERPAAVREVPMSKTSWIVITGAPGAGKTSLIRALAARGYETTSEVARAYLASAASRTNQLELQRALVARQKDLERALSPERMIFLDRALPDAIGYYHFLGLPEAEISQVVTAHRYSRVFLLAYLPDLLFDPCRPENVEARIELGRCIEAGYAELGYKVARVPALPIETRLEFILKNLGEKV